MILRGCLCVTAHLSGPVECTPRVNPNENYGLGVMMRCPCRFINGHKCTTRVGVTDSEEGCTSVGAGRIREISLSSSQFCCEPRTALKKINKSFSKLRYGIGKDTRFSLLSFDELSLPTLDQFFYIVFFLAKHML